MLDYFKERCDDQELRLMGQASIIVFHERAVDSICFELTALFAARRRCL
jgi:hypothetical protein